MGVRITVGDLLYEATDYSVREDATPLSAADSSGGVGTVNFTITRPDRDLWPDHPINLYTKAWLLGQPVSLTDTQFGFTLGEVTSADYDATRGAITISCISRLGELNDYNIQAEPYIGTLGGAFRYYAELGGATLDVSVDPAVEDRPVAMPGWHGELWYHLKQLAVAQDCEVSLVAGIILLRPIRARVAEPDYTADQDTSAGGGQLAQAVEVYWYKTTPVENELVYPPGGWTPEVEVLNVNAGEDAEYTLEMDSSLSSIEAPTMETFVPAESGSYRITVVGAQGGGPSGGRGARMSGVFNLSKDQALKILVGQQGNPDTSPSGNRGGGGGSFVWDNATNVLLIAAGGGGGSHTNGTGNALGMDAVTGPNGTTKRDGNGTPGTGGNGAPGGAAGWLSNGGTTSVGTAALRPLAGGTGADGYSATTHFGGFGGGGGGGGSPSTTHASGGGGGYSGGAGQGSPASVGGGGGGSYNSGSGQWNAPGVGEGNGRVEISFLGSTSTLLATSTGRTGTVQNFVAPFNANSASVYTVVADDGLPVPPALWEDHGGKVEVTLNPDTTTLTVEMTGAENIPLATGGTSRSFSLALASDESGSRYSTLRIVGTGVSYQREKKRIRTGVPASRTSTEVGVTIDNPFLNSIDDLYRAGTRAAKQYTGETLGLTGSVVRINRRGDRGVPLITYGQTQEALEDLVGGGPFTYSYVTYVMSSGGFETYGAVQDYWASFEDDSFERQAFGNIQGARVWDSDTRRWYRVRSGSTTAGGVTFSAADDDLVFEDVESAYGTMTYSDVQSLNNALTYSQERMAGLRA